jgi:hypothetical protein
MSEIVIEGVDDLYGRLLSSTLNPSLHGPLVAFQTKARYMKDPNVCSCKKGKKAQEDLVRLYVSLPSQIRNEPYLSEVKILLGGETIVFRSNGAEFARIG